jgi:CHAD domain-containing protein
VTIESSKWVACDVPGQAAGGVVRHALAGRLAVVEHYLEPASIAEGHESEHIHQLRVATRRAGAALSAFSAFLPRGKRKRMRRALKRIRRAAGAARDLDVLAGRYQSPRDAIGDAAHDWLWARISEARRAAHPAVDEVFRLNGGGRFARRGERLLDRVRWRGEGEEPTFVALARQKLGRAAHPFFDIARRRPQRAGGQHELRIAAKQFRYSLELFAAIAGELRDDVYPIVEEVQQRLGKANDRAVAAQRIAAWQRRHALDAGVGSDQVEAIVKRERKKAAAARREFLEWWTSERCDALAARFDDLMATVADGG